MSRSTIAKHPERIRIERDLSLGLPLRVISKRYGVSRDAAHRWKRNTVRRSLLSGQCLGPSERAVHQFLMNPK